jgi:hypothetical protein
MHATRLRLSMNATRLRLCMNAQASLWCRCDPYKTPYGRNLRWVLRFQRCSTVADPGRRNLRSSTG